MPFGESIGGPWPGPGGRGKLRPEQGRMVWAQSRGARVVFGMTAGDLKWSICSIMELSREIGKSDDCHRCGDVEGHEGECSCQGLAD